MPLTAEPKDVLIQSIDSLTVAELDALPHGAIQLDASGIILQYNSFESELANVSQDAAIGKNFFKELAPCTDVQAFYGKFKEGVAAKELYARFQYHFSFKHQPRDVVVTMYYSGITHTVWVFIRPLGYS